MASVLQLSVYEGFLPEPYYGYFLLLTSAMYVLMKNHVEPEDVTESTQKITEFVVKVQFLHGKAQMSSNVHTPLHLPKTVLLHGPLWALSCFPFESNMGHLLMLVTFANGVPFQILSRLLLRSNFLQLLSVASDRVRIV